MFNYSTSDIHTVTYENGNKVAASPFLAIRALSSDMRFDKLCGLISREFFQHNTGMQRGYLLKLLQLYLANIRKTKNTNDILGVTFFADCYLTQWLQS